ncbi:hypothetical protein LCGC14_2233990, partial [marine sediment metagenome]
DKGRLTGEELGDLGKTLKKSQKAFDKEVKAKKAEGRAAEAVEEPTIDPELLKPYKITQKVGELEGKTIEKTVNAKTAYNKALKKKTNYDKFLDCLGS